MVRLNCNYKKEDYKIAGKHCKMYLYVVEVGFR